MARIITQQTSLKKVFWVKSIPGLLLVIAGITIIIVMFIKEGINIPYIIVGAFLFWMGISLILRNRTFLSGAKGEKLVSRTLSNFPDDWFVFNDVIIRDTPIDHILVCPKGIYAIETKHYRGTISGDAADTDWWQFIQSRQIRRYNPVRQTLHHAVSLANYLRESGYSEVWVEPIVVFSHPEVKLEVTSHKVPVIYLSRLSEFLNSRDQIMGSQKCEEISTNLNNYLTGNIKTNYLITRWLPIALIIIVILGAFWLVTPRKSSSPPKTVISWEQASEYVDQIKTVKGEIVKIRIDNNSQAYFLNFSKDPNAFYVVIFDERVRQSILSKVKEGDIIWVTGKISKYNGIPQIKVYKSDQIEIK